MEVVDLIKLGLQTIGTGIAVILFFKREMESFKKELRESIEKNSEKVQRIERELLEYQKEALEKFVRKDDFDRIHVSLEELKALILAKEEKNGKTT